MPLYESVAAGEPVDANPDAVGTIRLPRDMVGSGNVFAVRVTGGSMVDANIFDGDCVVVRHQNDAVNGDIVAALIEDRGTVKTFLRTEGHVWLMPENPSYEPILGTVAGSWARWWPRFTAAGTGDDALISAGHKPIILTTGCAPPDHRADQAVSQ